MHHLKSISGNQDIANANPFRYRGYYYDNESGLYYLQSRYYDSCTGRFLNADSLIGANGDIISNNLFTYCSNNPVMNTDPTGYFTIRRWMVSTLIDIFLMLIPGIGSAFAPIKALAKSYGKAALKTKIKTPLTTFIRYIAKNATKILTGFKNAVKKVAGEKIAKKIPITKLVNILAGATASATINKFLNVLIPNIDIVLSVGGAVAGILDYAFDKKLNNSIWVI